MKAVSPKTKLVVIDEHTLGYIDSRSPNLYSTLHSSILRGASFVLWPGSRVLSSLHNVRLATEQDFKDYRCCFKGFKESGDYEYGMEKRIAKA